jgi:tRNA G18 (ribose-2'-O)-methylase SpoU
MSYKISNFGISKIILLDSIRSMQNVGAIFRNCDGAWFEKVILTGYSPTPPRKDISKTALSAQKWIDWEYYKDPFEIVNILKKEGYKIYSVELDERSIDYTELFLKNNDKVCLIMWNEIFWVNKKLLDLSDEIVIIPMRWKKESLNVSVAAWIVMYAV